MPYAGMTNVKMAIIKRRVTKTTSKEYHGGLLCRLCSFESVVFVFLSETKSWVTLRYIMQPHLGRQN